MNVPHRRGACPGLSAPMLTGDGLLVRFSPVESMSLAAFAGLCAAARKHGNGTMEISAHGNLQVRGLTPRSAPMFARAVAAFEIAAAEGMSITVDPLADDPQAVIDTRGLAADLRAAIAHAGLALAPKVSVLLDGGGRLHLDALAADVRLRAVAMPQGPRLHVSIAGDAASATPLGRLAAETAVDVVLRLLGVIASHGQDARAAEIVRKHGIHPFHSAVARLVERSPALPARAPAEVVGGHPLRDGSLALGLALAFGHAHADDLIALTGVAAEHRARALRLAPGRGLLLLGLPRAKAAALAGAAEGRGFIAHPDDPRRRIVACPGKPACTSGLIAARALAHQLAPHLPASSVVARVHISGCAKGCAHPRIAALTVVGTEHGCGIIRRGTARDAPDFYVDADRLVAEIARLETARDEVVDA
jgi:precorrin-3B synthase